MKPVFVDTETDLPRRIPHDLKRGWCFEDFSNYRITVPGENSEDSLHRLIVELYSFAGATGKQHHTMQTERRASWQQLSTFQREMRASAYGLRADAQTAEVLALLRKSVHAGFVLSRPERNRWCWTWQQFYEPMERLDDMVINLNPGDRNMHKGHPSIWTHCPVCRGYGGWVLKDNCYAPYDRTQPPPAGWTWDSYVAFYGPREHFRASCSQCNGWGWVEKTSTDAACIHTDVELSSKEATALGVVHFGMCWHVYQCSKCKRIRSEDSSG